jgi:hypothetical protein
VDAFRAVSAARIAWLEAAKAERKLNDETKEFVSAFRQALLTLFGPEAGILADFDVSVRKPRTEPPLTEKVQASAKAKATRAARHTLGPKQKRAIKGEVHATPPAVPGPATPPATNGAPTSHVG